MRINICTREGRCYNIITYVFVYVCACAGVCVHVCVFHYRCACMFFTCVCVVSICLHAHVCGVQVFICTNGGDTPQESPTLDLNLQFNAQATLAE